MPRFAFHKAAVKFPEVFVVEAFAKALKSFATARFYECEDEETVEEEVFSAAAFNLEFEQLININILSLPA